MDLLYLVVLGVLDLGCSLGVSSLWFVSLWGIKIVDLSKALDCVYCLM